MANDIGNSIPPPATRKSSRNRPVFIFFGFLFLGAALAFVLFGGDLLNSTSSKEGEVNSGGLLDQVADLSEVSGRSSNPLPDSGILEVGDKASIFSLLDFSGSEVSLADFPGQPVIINLWATWCAPCRIEMPALEDAYHAYQDQGLVILALNQDEPLEVASQYFYDEMDLSFTPLLDEDSLVAAKYGGLYVLPTTYFINTEGIVSAIHRGPLTSSQIDGYLAEMVPREG